MKLSKIVFSVVCVGILVRNVHGMMREESAAKRFHVAPYAVADDLLLQTLHAAASAGNVPALRRLLVGDADVNVRVGESNETPLHCAIAHSCVDACRFLIENGADVDAQDDIGNTPLHCAAICDHVAVCRVLLAHRANQCLSDGMVTRHCIWRVHLILQKCCVRNLVSIDHL